MQMYMSPHAGNNNWFVNGFTDNNFDFFGSDFMYTAEMLQCKPFYFPFEISTERPEGCYVFPIRVDFCCHINITDNIGKFLNQLTLNIPDQVLTDIRSNRCKILFDHSRENYNVVDFPEQNPATTHIVNRTIEYYQLKRTDAILITGNYKTADSNRYSVAIKNWSETLIQPCDSDFFLKQQVLIVNKISRPKKILTFMHKERTYRANLAHYIYTNNLREDNIVTLGKNITALTQNYASSNYPQWKEFVDTLPWHYDVELNSNVPMDMLFAETSAEQQAYLDTYINGVAETYITARPNELDISEKTFKPIAYLQPFFVFGQSGTLAYLHSRGYKTFSKWWDESYDCVQDPRIKFNMLTNLYKRLSSMSHDQLSDMLCEMWPILEHNYWIYCDYVQSGKSYQHLLKTVEQCFDK
jgi:hypothetical protein